MTLFELFARSAGAGLVAADLVRISDRLTAHDVWQSPACDLLAALLEPQSMDLLNRPGQAGGQRLVLVQRQVLLLQSLPAILCPVERDGRHPIRLADDYREPAVGIKLQPLHETRTPLIDYRDGIPVVRIFHE